MQEVLDRHIANGRRYFDQFGGHYIKWTGDGFLVAFRTAIEALSCTAALFEDSGDERLLIRAGIHVGVIRIREENDVAGGAANFTSRVMGTATHGGIVLSSDAYSQITSEKAPEHESLWMGLPRTVTLSSFPGEHQVYPVTTLEGRDVHKRFRASAPKEAQPEYKSLSPAPANPPPAVTSTVPRRVPLSGPALSDFIHRRSNVVPEVPVHEEPRNLLWEEIMRESGPAKPPGDELNLLLHMSDDGKQE